jgi:hypothetical protein
MSTEAAPPGAQIPQRARPKKLRIWPAIALLFFVLAGKVANPLYMQQAEPNVSIFLVIIFGQVICCGALALWWLLFTRAPWSDRVLGLAGAAVGSAVAWFMSDQSIHSMMFLFYALPGAVLAFTVAFVILSRWGARVATVAALIAWALVFGYWDALRCDGMWGNFKSTHWRWEKTPEETLPSTGKAEITFVIPAGGVIGALAFVPLTAEFEKRGYSCKFVPSPNRSKTPNQDLAKNMVEALKNVKGDIVLVGVSGQGLFMPLVAAERPIRRIVMLNAVVPTPGKSFQEAFDFEKVFATKFARRLAERAPEMSEVCPLKELPKVEYVYVCGEKDDAIRPEWEQWAARELLHVEPVVLKGARHANIVFYVKQVVDAATKGLEGRKNSR